MNKRMNHEQLFKAWLVYTNYSGAFTNLGSTLAKVYTTKPLGALDKVALLQEMCGQATNDYVRMALSRHAEGVLAEYRSKLEKERSKA